MVYSSGKMPWSSVGNKWCNAWSPKLVSAKKAFPLISCLSIRVSIEYSPQSRSFLEEYHFAVISFDHIVYIRIELWLRPKTRQNHETDPKSQATTYKINNNSSSNDRGVGSESWLNRRENPVTRWLGESSRTYRIASPSCTTSGWKCPEFNVITPNINPLNTIIIPNIFRADANEFEPPNVNITNGITNGMKSSIYIGPPRVTQ